MVQRMTFWGLCCFLSRAEDKLSDENGFAEDRLPSFRLRRRQMALQGVPRRDYSGRLHDQLVEDEVRLSRNQNIIYSSIIIALAIESDFLMLMIQQKYSAHPFSRKLESNESLDIAVQCNLTMYIYFSMQHCALFFQTLIHSLSICRTALCGVLSYCVVWF